MMNPQRPENLLKQTTYLLLEANKAFQFHCVRKNKKFNRVKINYQRQQNKFLTGVQDETLF